MVLEWENGIFRGCQGGNRSWHCLAEMLLAHCAQGRGDDPKGISLEDKTSGEQSAHGREKTRIEP